MELLFESTEAFERDLAALSDTDREKLIEAINRQCPLLACDQQIFFSRLYQPRAVRLRHDCCSSLSVMPVDDEQAIILTVDDDPIFGQMIITLLRIVPAAKVETAYDRMAAALYGRGLQEGEGERG
ncbi:MAG: hypothetical protein ABFD81_06905 [Syntrophaceae bacterium]